MGQKIDKEVFDKFFKESYCTVEYETVKEEFERIASIGNDPVSYTHLGEAAPGS